MVQSISNEDCANVYPPDLYPITDYVLCTTADGKDSCNVSRLRSLFKALTRDSCFSFVRTFYLSNFTIMIGLIMATYADSCYYMYMF